MEYDGSWLNGKIEVEKEECGVGKIGGFHGLGRRWEEIHDKGWRKEKEWMRRNGGAFSGELLAGKNGGGRKKRRRRENGGKRTEGRCFSVTVVSDEAHGVEVDAVSYGGLKIGERRE
ncbi:uncharacterized protein G2W53_022067 [Senna tora]|uniref:Uncharacterized protein n=1 Tax=Senna tora TaxID=362788 RepID=A0A834WK49_9FABA|nr:uncharacterized protein G2W53_022067 [Senna tora]